MWIDANGDTSKFIKLIALAIQTEKDARNAGIETETNEALSKNQIENVVIETKKNERNAMIETQKNEKLAKAEIENKQNAWNEEELRKKIAFEDQRTIVQQKTFEMTQR